MNPAPDFALSSDEGRKISLRDFRRKSVILYFYPKDMTPGCAREACDFRDNWLPLLQKDAVVLGVSADPARKHAAFKKNTPFPLPSREL